MPLLYVRSRVPYQQGDPSNATDVLVNEVHFNRTALDYYNYTLYSNGTLSNSSDCYLAFGTFKPAMGFWFQNSSWANGSWFNGTWDGSFVNGTTCYSPVKGLGRTATLGMVFALLFCLGIIQTFGNIRKHGRRYLPVHQQRLTSSAAGRRGKWCWLLALAVCGTVSCFMTIDVDRGYVQSTPIMLQGIFYTLMTPIMMAAVWEAVRHWYVLLVHLYGLERLLTRCCRACLEERQVYTGDPLKSTLRANSPSHQEFWLPLLFYVCAFMSFFLAVPRSWRPLQFQNSPDQLDFMAKPTATDTRFKASSLLAIAATLVICYRLELCIHRSVDRPAGHLNSAMYYFNALPSQFVIAILLLSSKVGYAVASVFDWTISPLRYQVHPGWLFGLGYTPALLVIILFNVCGWCDVNEDKFIAVERPRVTPARPRPRPRTRPAATVVRSSDSDATTLASKTGLHDRPTWTKAGQLTVRDLGTSDSFSLDSMSHTNNDNNNSNTNTYNNNNNNVNTDRFAEMGLMGLGLEASSEAAQAQAQPHHLIRDHDHDHDHDHDSSTATTLANDDSGSNHNSTADADITSVPVADPGLDFGLDRHSQRSGHESIHGHSLSESSTVADDGGSAGTGTGIGAGAGIGIGTATGAGTGTGTATTTGTATGTGEDEVD